jgi:hypothetical protein
LQGKTYAITILMDVKRRRRTQIDHHLHHRILCICPWNSLKMRDDALWLTDNHGLFLPRTEMGRLDVKGKTQRVVLLFDLHLWRDARSLHGHNRLIGTRVQRDARDHRAGKLRRP